MPQPRHLTAILILAALSGLVLAAALVAALSIDFGPDPIESEPLAARSAAKSSVMFERLDSAATGIDFVYLWEKTIKHGSLYHGQSTGGSVCLGDYDGDGRTDLLLTRPQDGSRLYRNLGDMRFEDVTRKAGLEDRDEDGMWAMGASFADV
ncbi:MAG: VCBS repeat-containing protein, partial [Vicinamibacterales bacterium]|nr:VCBS repeat-containing protein [Vicinamibacterales bacterium]